MRRSLWVLLSLLAACAVLEKPREDPRPIGSLERLKRDPKGVCASVVDVGAEPWSAQNREAKTTLGDKLLSSMVEACARVKPGSEGAGEGAIVQVALIFAQQDEHWRPEFWHVEVIRQNGLVVQAGDLQEDRVEDGTCVLDVCNKEGYATVALSEPWQADRYRIRLTHVPTRKRVELVITLN